jgi:hypothetical protein
VSEYEQGWTAGQAHVAGQVMKFLERASTLCAYEEPDEETVSAFRKEATAMLAKIKEYL